MRCISSTARTTAKWVRHFMTTPGTYRDTITLKSVPAGNYALEWIDPSTGTVKLAETKSHAGGDFPIATPPYTIDIALRIRRSPTPGK